MSEKRLLIVDDEPELAEFVSIVAESLGYEVRTATTAAAFKAALEGFDPTVIILDIVMPETNGLELLGRLAERKSAARILVASGMNSTYAEAAQQLGSEGGLSLSFLDKPFRLDTLRAALGAAG